MASPNYASVSSTFLASIRSVGTAVSLASVGVYLHQRGFVQAEGKRTLALISQQVTVPLFLFTKIIYCNQDWSSNPCPDVTRSLRDVWMLLFWPAYVVLAGVMVGKLVARLTKTPPHQTRAVLAACAFGNSTGLPITLLTVVHANFPSTSDLGRIDPTLFLSVYLLLYPVLQWGFGGWLLVPVEHTEKEQDTMEANNGFSSPQSAANNIETSSPHHRPTLSDSLKLNVLNNTEIGEYYQNQRHGLSSADEGLYVSEADLVRMGKANAMRSAPSSMQSFPEGLEYENGTVEDQPLLMEDPIDPPILQYGTSGKAPVPAPLPSTRSTTSRTLRPEQGTTFRETFRNIMTRCLQPPVVGALVGILVAVTPLRGLFVDLVDRSSSAPFQWFFDGLYAVGTAAVPINMMILGCNLSASWQSVFRPVRRKSRGENDDLFSLETMIGVVVGKMILLPIVGIATSRFLRTYVLDIADDIDGAFYLVLMIVFLTPTANNVMVMVELSGSGAKEGIASVIAMQYAIAPVILSLTMSIAIGFASSWS